MQYCNGSLHARSDRKNPLQDDATPRNANGCSPYDSDDVMERRKHSIASQQWHDIYPLGVHNDCPLVPWELWMFPCDTPSYHRRSVLSLIEVHGSGTEVSENSRALLLNSGFAKHCIDQAGHGPVINLAVRIVY